MLCSLIRNTGPARRKITPLCLQGHPVPRQAITRCPCKHQVAEQLSVGAPLLPFHEPRNPNVVVAPAPRRPFQLTLRAVTTEPLVVEVAFQIWLSCCPFGKVMVTVQNPIVLGPAVTVTSPWKPPGHWLTLR